MNRSRVNQSAAKASERSLICKFEYTRRVSKISSSHVLFVVFGVIVMIISHNFPAELIKFHLFFLQFLFSFLWDTKDKSIAKTRKRFD
jgi:hypothetical protein